MVFLYQFFQERCSEAQIPWEHGDPKFTYLESQVLFYFDAFSEEEIGDQELKFEVAERIFRYALQQDLTLERPDLSPEADSFQESIENKVRPLYDFLPEEVLPEQEVAAVALFAEKGLGDGKS